MDFVFSFIMDLIISRRDVLKGVIIRRYYPYRNMKKKLLISCYLPPDI